jgi:hypothetical protein
MPKPSPREGQHLESPTKLTDELGRGGGKFEIKDFSEQSQSPEPELLEEEPLVNQEHNLEIKEFYFKSESSLEEEPDSSTSEHLGSKSREALNPEQIENPELKPNSECREKTKPEISDRGILVVMSKSKPK